MSENTELKSRIRELEEKNLELTAVVKEKTTSGEIVNMPNPSTIGEVTQLKMVFNFI